MNIEQIQEQLTEAKEQERILWAEFQRQEEIARVNGDPVAQSREKWHNTYQRRCMLEETIRLLKTEVPSTSLLNENL